MWGFVFSEKKVTVGYLFGFVKDVWKSLSMYNNIYFRESYPCLLFWYYLLFFNITVEVFILMGKYIIEFYFCRCWRSQQRVMFVCVTFNLSVTLVLSIFEVACNFFSFSLYVDKIFTLYVFEAFSYSRMNFFLNCSFLIKYPF